LPTANRRASAKPPQSPENPCSACRASWPVPFSAPEQGLQRYPKGEPLNHVGIEVDDLEAVEEKVIAAGLTPFAHGDYEPGRRFYFLDPGGIE
jgi:hypothetical protein